jgi:hypothetical protein
MRTPLYHKNYFIFTPKKLLTRNSSKASCLWLEKAQYLWSTISKHSLCNDKSMCLRHSISCKRGCNRVELISIMKTNLVWHYIPTPHCSKLILRSYQDMIPRLLFHFLKLTPVTIRNFTDNELFRKMQHSI